jgi:CheY-like chemotaxis protein
VTESTGQATDFSGKRALIVDDSKSARAFLSRMLEKHGIEVDTAETAEQAIVYLARTRPDVIFMDHLMPGMDGFQAVQSIKNNPRTATIPIMMFTSQEGELYLGQARALGALGVLPKQVKPAEVSTVLHQLRLVPDRRRARVTSFEPGNAVAHEAFQRPAAAAVSIAGLSTGTDGPLGAPPASPSERFEAGLSAAQLRALVEEIVRDQLGDLRRGFSGLLDEQSERLIAQVRELVAPPAAAVDPAGEALFAAHEPPPAPRRAPWLIAALASVAAASLALLWWREVGETQRLAAELVTTRGALATRTAEAARAAALPQAAPSSAEAGAMAPWRGASLNPSASAPSSGLPSAAAPAPRGASEAVQLVPYGEVPMAGERYESLRRLLDDLAARSFRGIVTVTAFPGRYCLVGGAAGEGLELAPGDAPLSKCELLGNPFDEQLGPAQREPLALANLVGAIRQRSGGAIDVQFVTGAESQRAASYPESSPRVTAGEWNRAAASNNRVEIRVQPAGT